jgi:hypothetical protein
MFKQAEERKKATSPQLGGQLDGSAFSSFSRGTRDSEITSSCDESTSTIKDSHEEDVDGRQGIASSLIDPSSRILTGPYSDSSSSESGSDHDAEGASGVNVDPHENNPEPLKPNAKTSSTPAHTNMDYLDLSEFATPPPSSDTDEMPLLSLSHSGTLGKQERSTSPGEGGKVKNKRAWQDMSEKEQSKSKRARRESPPDLNASVSIFRRSRPRKQSKQMPLSAPHTAPADFLHTLPTRSKPMPEPMQPPNSRFVPTDPRSIAPTGPRASNEQMVCFYWYHKGHCISKRKIGFKSCKYAHNLDMPKPKVSFPPHIKDEHLPCLLPLCPVKLAEHKHQDYNVRARDMTEAFVEHEGITPPRRGVVNNFYSSSPRDGFLKAQPFIKDPRSGRNSKSQLAKLTGANRAQLKVKKRNMAQWKADNSSMPSNRFGQMVVAEKTQDKGVKKQPWREKCARVMANLVGSRGAERVLDYGDGTLLTQDSDTATAPAMQPFKKNKEARVTRDARELVEVDAANDGRRETFASGAELHKDSFPYLSDFTKHSFVRDSQDGVGARQKHAGHAMDMVKALNDQGAPSDLRWLNMPPTLVDEVERAEDPIGGGTGMGPKAQGNKKRRILVDYELPRGGGRLDWDTDLVRRLFGEIE